MAGELDNAESVAEYDSNTGSKNINRGKKQTPCMMYPMLTCVEGDEHRFSVAYHTASIGVATSGRASSVAQIFRRYALNVGV